MISRANGTQYTGVVLVEDDQEMLISYFANLYLVYLMPVGFATENARGDRLAHHMTMNMGTCKNRNLLGMEVVLTIDAWAMDERALAVRVKDHAGVYCENETPHITVMVNPKKGGSPRHSNGLTNWVPLPDELVVIGTVTEV